MSALDTNRFSKTKGFLWSNKLKTYGTEQFYTAAGLLRAFNSQMYLDNLQENTRMSLSISQLYVTRELFKYYPKGHYQSPEDILESLH